MDRNVPRENLKTQFEKLPKKKILDSIRANNYKISTRGSVSPKVLDNTVGTVNTGHGIGLSFGISK